MSRDRGVVLMNAARAHILSDNDRVRSSQGAKCGERKEFGAFKPPASVPPKVAARVALNSVIGTSELSTSLNQSTAKSPAENALQPRQHTRKAEAMTSNKVSALPALKMRKTGDVSTSKSTQQLTKLWSAVPPPVQRGKQSTLDTSLTIDEEALTQRIHKTLRDKFGHTGFRGDQETAIRLILQGKNVLFVAPTGGGKSLTYQLPALLFPGVTIVVSPLIALMKDQVTQLSTLGIKAGLLGTGATKEEKKLIQADLQRSRPMIKLLFVSPELLTSRTFLALFDSLFKRKSVSFVAIDEAHCVSAWGHSFRPSFLRLSVIRQKYPSIPLLALTATATAQVKKDISESLCMNPYVTLMQNLNRPNVEYILKHKENLPGEQLFDDIVKSIQMYEGGSGIIYTHTREAAELLGTKLSKKKLSLGVYHAGLKTDQRTSIQLQWMTNKIQVIIATVAFGMGIDKKDVRFVLHFNLPVTLEAFYQESGRCGRDGKNSTSILYYSQEDRMRGQYFCSIPDKKTRESDSKSSSTNSGSSRSNRNEPVPVDHKLHLFASMIKFCESGECRRKVVLEYFGQTRNAPQERCCDVCKDPEAAKESLKAAIATGKASPLLVSDDVFIPLAEREFVSRSQQRKMGFRYSEDDEESNSASESEEAVSDDRVIGFRSVGSIVAAAGTARGRKEMFALFRKAEEEDEQYDSRAAVKKPKQDNASDIASYKGLLLGVNGTQIPGVLISNRELCLNKFTEKLRANCAEQSIHGPQLEYHIFSTAKTKTAYFEEARRILGDIQNSTASSCKFSLPPKVVCGF